MKKRLVLILVIIFVMALAAGCASTASELDYNKSYGGADTMESPGYSDNIASEVTNGAAFGLKIVYTASLDIETLEFSTSYEAILSALNKAGGYVSATNQRGGNTADGGYTPKYAYLELKVPADQYQAFLAGSSDFGHVASRDENSYDITSVYVDTQARLDTLVAQETRLLELLAKANSIQDLISLEERLSQVRGQIESLTAQMKAYDNQLEYCTVTINLREVGKLTEDKNFWQNLGENILNSLKVLVGFLYGVLMAVVYALPFAILAGIGFVIVWRLTRKNRLRRREKASFKDAENK